MQAVVTLKPDFSTITEHPGQGATRLQLEMLQTRYAWAAGHAAGKDVAEIACGAGLGLGWLARMARSVEGGDLDDTNCRIALETYAGREKIRVQRMDALALPFGDRSLDLLLLFEAIYYLPDTAKFFMEVKRVLRAGGRLLLSTVNPEWTGFNPSPFHTRYLSAAELEDALTTAGFAATVRAGFRERRGILDWPVAKIRQVAVAAGMIPETMAGKEFLKRLFYGSLAPIRAELEPVGGTERFQDIVPGMNLSRYRTLYAEARKLR